MSWTDSLIWALGHPDGDRAVMAARSLGRLRAPEAAPALRAVVEAGADVYLRAEALLSVIAISGPDSLRPWLVRLSQSGPLRVREIAREALGGSRRGA
ncbi:MAG: HEAT repeat domain-containing protein [Streptosporangiaceae bacterium]